MQQLKQSSKLFNASRADALTLLHTWIDQPGFPLVNISPDGSAQQQGRFYDWGSQNLADPFSPNISTGAVQATNSNTTVTSRNTTDNAWYVPMSLGQGAAAAGSEDAGSDSEWVELSTESAVAVILADSGSANLGGAGYYRWVWGSGFALLSH